MSVRFALLLAVTCSKLFETVTGKYDYCKVKCNPDQSPAFTCDCESVTDCFIPEGVDWPKFRREMLDAHNAIRNRLATAATDAEKYLNIHGATDMKAMSYDYELEFAARCHVKRCLDERACAITPAYGKSGQIRYTDKTAHTDPKELADLYMQTFYVMEMTNLNAQAMDRVKASFYDDINSIGIFGRIGHMTQIVWAKSKLVGCWYAQGWLRKYVRSGTSETEYCNDDRQFIMVCNYAPAGNVFGAPVFRDGQAAADCPNGTINEKYEGLCGEDVLPPPPYPKEKYGHDDPDSATLMSAFRPLLLVFGSIFFRL